MKYRVVKDGNYVEFRNQPEADQYKYDNGGEIHEVEDFIFVPSIRDILEERIRVGKEIYTEISYELGENLLGMSELDQSSYSPKIMDVLSISKSRLEGGYLDETRTYLLQVIQSDDLSPFNLILQKYVDRFNNLP